MRSYTSEEKKVFNSIVDITYKSSHADINTIQQHCDLKQNEIKQAVSNLITDGNVFCDAMGATDISSFTPLFPIVGEYGDTMSFGSDAYTPEQKDSFKWD